MSEELKPVAYCDVCDRPLYPGDEAIYMDGDWFCDVPCLLARVGADWETVGEDGETCEL